MNNSYFVEVNEYDILNSSNDYSDYSDNFNNDSLKVQSTGNLRFHDFHHD